MAGPYTGAWRIRAVQQTSYSGASKWGTGYNPVHRNTGPGPNLRQNPKLTYYPESPPGGENTESFSDDMGGLGYYPEDNPGQYYAYNITDSSVFGVNESTGLADHPRWGSEMADQDSGEMSEGYMGLPNPQDPGKPVTVVRGKTQNSTDGDYPSWGGSRKVFPGGFKIRSIKRGDSFIVKARVLPNEDVAQGWENKAHGIPADSKPADDSQVFIQTSMIQRYKTRAGSQREGSQSTFDAPIESRVTGQKLKVFAGSGVDRHWDMLPYQQEDYLRPFLSRQAGTGYREWQYPNEMYVSPVVQREPAPDPELGPVSGADQSANLIDYGYSYEDSGAYY